MNVVSQSFFMVLCLGETLGLCCAYQKKHSKYKGLVDAEREEESKDSVVRAINQLKQVILWATAKLAVIEVWGVAETIFLDMYSCSEILGKRREEDSVLCFPSLSSETI